MNFERKLKSVLCLLSTARTKMRIRITVKHQYTHRVWFKDYILVRGTDTMF